MDDTTRYTDPPKPMTRTRLILLVIAWSPAVAAAFYFLIAVLPQY